VLRTLALLCSRDDLYIEGLNILADRSFDLPAKKMGGTSMSQSCKPTMLPTISTPRKEPIRLGGSADSRQQHRFWGVPCRVCVFPATDFPHSERVRPVVGGAEAIGQHQLRHKGHRQILCQ